MVRLTKKVKVVLTGEGVELLRDGLRELGERIDGHAELLRKLEERIEQSEGVAPAALDLRLRAVEQLTDGGVATASGLDRQWSSLQEVSRRVSALEQGAGATLAGTPVERINSLQRSVNEHQDRSSMRGASAER